MTYNAPSPSPDGLIAPDAYRRADGGFPRRDGSNPIERMALHRANLDVGAMPASVLVQLLLWPAQLAEIARSWRRTPALIYNALSGANRRPYHAVRSLLVGAVNEVLETRGVSGARITRRDMDHLIDTPAAEHHGEAPLPAPGLRSEPLELPQSVPFDPDEPPRVRDGSSPLERACLLLLHAQIAALPASEVVRLALWPRSLAGWAADGRRDPNAVYHCLLWHHHQAYRSIRAALARTLDVSEAAVDWLIEAERESAPERCIPAPPRKRLAPVRTPPVAFQRSLAL